MAQKNWKNMIDIDEVFLKKVYEQVARIPVGRVSTYGKIGELAGYTGAAREVGIAMSCVPNGSALPCHRVVNQNGTLAPSYAFGSQEKQRKMLQSEGVTFLPDQTIHVRRHMWPEDPRGVQLSMFD